MDLFSVNRIKDVRVLAEDDFIAVVHPLPDMAEKAIRLIKGPTMEEPSDAVNGTN